MFRVHNEAMKLGSAVSDEFIQREESKGSGCLRKVRSQESEVNVLSQKYPAMGGLQPLDF